MPKEHFPYDRTLRELFHGIPKRFTETIAGKRVKSMPVRKREVFLKEVDVFAKLRGDLMREYEILRKEVAAADRLIELEKDPAYVKGIEQGIDQGIEKGIEKGLILEAQDMVTEALVIRFV